MKIADIDLGEQPLLLAPMEDVTDPSFRYMCKRFGADVVYTEFISSDGNSSPPTDSSAMPPNRSRNSKSTTRSAPWAFRSTAI